MPGPEGQGKAAKSPRVFLFLQGPSSPLFRWIGAALEKRGHQARRINICPGDWMFWRGAGVTNYRGTKADWPAFVAGFMVREGVTDLVLLGEERPYHRDAIAAATARGIDVYVVEMGYLRPDWITLERGGMSTNSHFPNHPAQILAAARDLAEPDFTPRHRHGFLAEALYDLAYNLPNVFVAPLLFPHYRWHAIYHPLSEYAGWLRRLGASRSVRRRVEMRMAKLTRPYFLVPLQLQTDYQIRVHSTFSGQEEAIATVLESFSKNAAPGDDIVFKVHPLDNGLIDWEREIGTLAARLGLDGRVHYLEGGDLGQLVEGARGVVTINSTVGLQALARGKPTKVLGTALFDVERLTDRQEIDGFWRNPRPPEPELRAAFFRLLAAAIHVRGNFYSREGAKAAAEAAARRLDERSVNEPGAFVAEPPRKRA